jgi:UDP-N-acetylglucosamine--N-acetylmuramyl-(pentapeptide) pyrophosphoryl-undecaprenol N-acetylglucosamine transferase
MKSNKNTILLVGGGTGGHIVPILNIYKKLKQNDPDLDICVVGGNTALDHKFYDGIDNYYILYTGKFHRMLTLNNILQLLLLLFGLIQAIVILLRIHPRVIFSKAGYVSLPIIFWAKILKIPYCIHESDIFMGKSNEFAASGAKKVFVGFPKNNYQKKYQDKMEFSGQILRPEIENIKKNLYDFNLNKTKPTIFITGGSQGARNINNAIFSSLAELLLKYNLIHHVGALDYKRAIEIRSNLKSEQKKSYYISDLLTDSRDGKSLLLSAVYEADLVVTRASATTLGEIAALSKPIIAIPYKHAAADHQSKNAEYFRKNKAAMVISDDRNLKGNLVKEIDRLNKNRAEMNQMAKNANDLFPKDGSDQIVKEIAAFLN